MGRSCKREEKLVTDAEIKADTGKSWQEWFIILDDFGVEEKGHSLTVKFLREHHGLTMVRAKDVALRYENDRGLRSLIA